MFLQTKEAAIKALVEIDDQGGKNKFSYKFIILIIYYNACGWVCLYENL